MGITIKITLTHDGGFDLSSQGVTPERVQEAVASLAAAEALIRKKAGEPRAGLGCDGREPAEIPAG